MISPSNPASNSHTLVTLYSKPDCHLCDIAKERILNAQKQIYFDLKTIDITTDSDLFETYKERIPVVLVNGEEAYAYRVSEKGLIKKIRADSLPWWKRLLGR